MHQYGDFNSRSNSFASLDSQHAMLKASHDKEQETKEIRQRRRYDARHTWALCTSKELSSLAIALLSITASEAAVERTFSRQGLVHSKLRNRLSNASVQSQMFFSFNSRALEQAERDSNASWEEVPDEDVKRGTALLSREDELASEEEEEEEEEEQQQQEEEEEKGGGVVLEEEEEEEEEEQEQERRDDGGKEEKKEERPREEILQEFIGQYVAERDIDTHYRWPEHKQNELQNALIAAGRKDMLRDVIKKIKKYVAAQSE
jgi:hypothetical protein